MSTLNLITVQIENEYFQAEWQDLGIKKRLTVFQGDKTIGFKEFGLLVDDGLGVVVHTVKSLLNNRECCDHLERTNLRNID